MSIYVKKKLNFNDIVKETWCCEFVLDAINKNNLKKEFMAHLEEMFFMNGSEIPTMTELSDYIRFKSDTIFECLGLNKDGEMDEENQ